TAEVDCEVLGPGAPHEADRALEVSQPGGGAGQFGALQAGGEPGEVVPDGGAVEEGLDPAPGQGGRAGAVEQRAETQRGVPYRAQPGLLGEQPHREPGAGQGEQ